MHLADTHPAAGLMPPLGTGQRAQAYKWLAWLNNTLQATLILYFYPERWGDEAAAAQVKAHAEAKIGDDARPARRRVRPSRRTLAARRALQHLRSLRLRALPLDARLRPAGAHLPHLKLFLERMQATAGGGARVRDRGPEAAEG